MIDRLSRKTKITPAFAAGVIWSEFLQFLLGAVRLVLSVQGGAARGYVVTNARDHGTET